MNMTYNGSTAQSGDYSAAQDFKVSTATAAWHTLPLDIVDRPCTKRPINRSALRYAGRTLGRTNGDIPYQGFPNQHMDMTGNDSKQINLRYAGQYQWGALEARVYDEKTRHAMQFYDDKRYWYGTASGTGAPCSPIGATCAAGMPMDTEGKTTGALVKADILLSERDILRVGGEYQHYRLNDWWPPVGVGGMSPETFWNIKNGERDRFDVLANGKRAGTRNGSAS